MDHASTLEHEEEIVAVPVDEVNRVALRRPHHADGHVLVEEQRHASVDRRHVLRRHLLRSEVPLAERARRRGCRKLPPVREVGGDLRMGAVLVVGDGVGAIEPAPRDALFVAQDAVLFEADVVLGGDGPCDNPVEH